MTRKEVATRLCYYDLRNPYGIVEDTTDEEDLDGLGNHERKHCACDNCFYGRHKLADYILTLLDEHHDK